MFIIMTAPTLTHYLLKATVFSTSAFLRTIKELAEAEAHPPNHLEEELQERKSDLSRRLLS